MSDQIHLKPGITWQSQPDVKRQRMVNPVQQRAALEEFRTDWGELLADLDNGESMESATVDLNLLFDDLVVKLGL